MIANLGTVTENCSCLTTHQCQGKKKVQSKNMKVRLSFHLPVSNISYLKMLESIATIYIAGGDQYYTSIHWLLLIQPEAPLSSWQIFIFWQLLWAIYSELLQLNSQCKLIMVNISKSQVRAQTYNQAQSMIFV